MLTMYWNKIDEKEAKKLYLCGKDIYVLPKSMRSTNPFNAYRLNITNSEGFHTSVKDHYNLYKRYEPWGECELYVHEEAFNGTLLPFSATETALIDNDF